MKIDRLEPSGHVKGRFLAFLEDGAILKLTEWEVLDFSLRPGAELDGETLDRLRAAAGTSGVRDQAAAMLGRRAMSRGDLEKKLREKGASADDARYAAEWLEAIGAMDDAAYAAALVRHCADMGYGPARYREELRKHAIDRELWEDALAQAPDPAELAERYLRERFRGGLSEERDCRRAAAALARRGFDWPTVKEALRHAAEI